MNRPVERVVHTRGEKVWALDTASRVLWVALWNTRALANTTAAELDEVQLRRALSILERMAGDLSAQRGRLHRRQPKAKP